MNWLAKLIKSEPVAFWTGLVGTGIGLAVQFGAPIDQPTKDWIVAGVGIVCTAIARSQSTSAAPKTP